MNPNFDAATSGAPLNCLVCEKEIPEGLWFARVKVGDRRAVLCRPGCADRFAEDRDTYARKLGLGSGAAFPENAALSPRLQHP